MLEVLCSKFETGDTTMKPYEKCLKLINCGPWLALIGTLLGGPPKFRPLHVKSEMTGKRRQVGWENFFKAALRSADHSKQPSKETYTRLMSVVETSRL
jgi:hypothetical protein